MKSLSDCYLYTFVDTGYLHDRSPEDAARQLCDGGSDLIQLRAKTASAEAVLRLGERLLPITESAGVCLVINDFPAIAARLGAPVCHLGQEDFFDAGYADVQQLREVVAEGQGSAAFKVGLSSHAPAQAERALAAGADYIAIGPVFETQTKPGAPAVTLEYVRWAAGHVALPWFAIGGITMKNLDAVLSAGARRICVVSAILQAADPVRACQAFKEHLLSAGVERTKISSLKHGS